MSGKCATKKGRGGSTSASRSPVLARCTGLQPAEQRKGVPRERCQPLPSRCSFKWRHTAQWVESRWDLATISGAPLCSTQFAQLQWQPQCYVGIEEARTWISQLKWPSKHPEHWVKTATARLIIMKFHNLGDKGMILELLGRSKTKVTFAGSETRKASNTSIATLEVKRL